MALLPYLIGLLGSMKAGVTKPDEADDMSQGQKKKTIEGEINSGMQSRSSRSQTINISYDAYQESKHMQVPGPSIRSHPDVTIKWAGLAIPHITPYPPHPAAPLLMAFLAARPRQKPRGSTDVGMCSALGGITISRGPGRRLMWAAAPLRRDVNQGLLCGSSPSDGSLCFGPLGTTYVDREKEYMEGASRGFSTALHTLRGKPCGAAARPAFA